MSATQRIQKNVDFLIPLCQEAHDQGNRFNEAWEKGIKQEGIKYKERVEYKELLQDWKKSFSHIYNKIFLIIKKLKNDDLSEIDVAMAFLKIDIRFFRSGYLKEDLCKALKHIKFSEDYKKIIQDIIINQFSIKGREFGEFGRLAIKVQDKEFEERISQLTMNTNLHIQLRAKWVLSLLNNTILLS